MSGFIFWVAVDFDSPQNGKTQARVNGTWVSATRRVGRTTVQADIPTSRGPRSTTTRPIERATPLAKTGNRVTDAMAAIIKRARHMGYNYETIASYFVINQGRIADVMKKRLWPDVAPASELPADFPALA